jgi:hypothetical protein
MYAARLAQPAPTQPPKARPADLPTAALRQAWTHVWSSLQDHMADLHGIPRRR